MPSASRQGSEAGCAGGVGMMGVIFGWRLAGRQERSRGVSALPAAGQRSRGRCLSVRGFTFGGDPHDAGQAQRPCRTAGDGETVSGYPLTAERPSATSGNGKEDLGGLQQVQAVIVGAVRTPQRPDTRPPDRAAGIRLAARRKRYGAARPAASRNLGGEHRIGHPHTRSPQGMVPVHRSIPPDLSSGRRRSRPV